MRTSPLTPNSKATPDPNFLPPCAHNSPHQSLPPISTPRLLPRTAVFLSLHDLTDNTRWPVGEVAVVVTTVKYYDKVTVPRC